MVSDQSESGIPALLKLSSKTSVLPIVHGSGQFANTVVQWLLNHSFDCVAIPLPASFQDHVEQAILELPKPSVVIQRSAIWTPDLPPDAQEEQSSFAGYGNSRGNHSRVNYVPIDPCQGVIAAIRSCIGEHIPRFFIDQETKDFEPFTGMVPDPYALRKVSPEKYAAALLPAIHRPKSKQTNDRVAHMARRLKQLEQQFNNILLISSVLEWPWIRESFSELKKHQKSAAAISETEYEPSEVITEILPVNPSTYPFMLGELPFITSLYERARSELDSSDDTQIDGVKELLLAARNNYRREMGSRGRRITSTHLSKCLQYIRNLSLIHRRLTPDLVTIITAAQQILGDGFALQVAEFANHYSAVHHEEPTSESVKFGIDRATLPNGMTVDTVSRLPNPPSTWKTVQLSRHPNQQERSKWEYKWNPYSQCSYPPEDKKIENFRSRVFERAKSIIGNDLARTEKFTTSIKDGIDIRDTIRNWHEKKIYVRVNPPNRGTLDTCVMLFDSPADPREYQWRTTWFAEHSEESTIAFFATHFADELVGPGIGVGTYGGALFLYPPIAIKDVWNDPQLDYSTTLEERLIAAACLHSRGKEIALMSNLPPGTGWKKLAKRHRKQLIHVPLSSFGDESIQSLRRVHVLNGKEVRSYAEEFIRKI